MTLFPTVVNLVLVWSIDDHRTLSHGKQPPANYGQFRFSSYHPGDRRNRSVGERCQGNCRSDKYKCKLGICWQPGRRSDMPAIYDCVVREGQTYSCTSSSSKSWRLVRQLRRQCWLLEAKYAYAGLCFTQLLRITAKVAVG